MPRIGRFALIDLSLIYFLTERSGTFSVNFKWYYEQQLIDWTFSIQLFQYFGVRCESIHTVHNTAPVYSV